MNEQPIMPSISFSYNWNNKLDCKAFTTIRLHNPEKYQKRMHYQILLNQKEKGIGEIIDIKTFFAHQLNDFMSYLDTGYNKLETLNILYKMYKKVNFPTQLFDFILIKYKSSTNCLP